MAIVSFRIRSFSKYHQQRKNVSSTYYFNVSNRFFFDPDWRDLTNDHVVAFFYALAECSGQNMAGRWDDLAKIHVEQAANLCRLPVDNFVQVLSDLEAKGFIEGVQGLTRVSETSCQTPQKHDPCARKKERKKEIYNSEVRAGYSEADLDLATRWLGALFSGKGEVNKEKAAETLRLCRERDGFTPEELERIFAFVQQSEFWSKNAQSPAGLRTKSKTYPDLSKIQVISSQMKNYKSDSDKQREYQDEYDRIPYVGSKEWDALYE